VQGRQEGDADTPGDEAEEPRAALAQVDQGAEEQTELDAAALMVDQASAMRLLLMRWSVELGALESQTPCAKVASFGLRCETDEGGWSRLRDYDRPALLKLRDGEGNQGFAALGALDAEHATLDLPEGSARVPLARLDEFWTGEYLMVWQPPPVGNHVIGPGSSGESVRWLRKLLSQVPGLDFTDSGSRRYNQSVRSAVRRFQTREGLEVDGIAGPRTLIRLHNAVAMPGPPRLQPET
jgi:general secretion pathway protein A